MNLTGETPIGKSAQTWVKIMNKIYVTIMRKQAQKLQPIASTDADILRAFKSMEEHDKNYRHKHGNSQLIWAKYEQS